MLYLISRLISCLISCLMPYLMPYLIAIGCYQTPATQHDTALLPPGKHAWKDYLIDRYTLYKHVCAMLCPTHRH